MTLNIENFEEVKIKGENFYKTLDEQYCPYFKSNIYFNTEGFNHLKFKNHAKARPRQDQYMRLKLLHLVPEVLKASATLQGIWETKNFERVRIHGRTDTILKEITYFEFIAIIKNVRLKVIVKQVENGQRFFWSIIPFWGINKDRTRKMYTGYPKED